MCNVNMKVITQEHSEIPKSALYSGLDHLDCNSVNTTLQSGLLSICNALLISAAHIVLVQFNPIVTTKLKSERVHYIAYTEHRRLLFLSKQLHGKLGLPIHHSL